MRFLPSPSPCMLAPYLYSSCWYFDLIFMYMLPCACEYECSCPGIPEEEVRFFRARLTGSCELPYETAGTELTSSVKAAGVPYL